MKVKKVFSVIFIILICAAVFFFSAVAYLGYEARKEQKASVPKTNEPYQYVPTNKGILFKFEDNTACLIYLDFGFPSVTAVFTDKLNVSRIGKYTVDYYVDADYSLIAGIIDRIGGIELKENGETKRFTGVQVTEMLSYKTNTDTFKKDIIEEIFKKISKNGFSKEDFVYIIENGGTDLLVPDCFYWEDYMCKLSLNTEVIL